METMEDNDVRKFGHCEECDSEITDDHYVTDDGKVICCIECLLEHFGVTKVEV